MQINISRTTSKPPCIDCNKRKVGCHSKCEDYKYWYEKELANKKKYKMMSDNSCSSGWSYARKKRG